MQPQQYIILQADNLPAAAAQKKAVGTAPANVDAGRQYGRPYSVYSSPAGAACPGRTLLLLMPCTCRHGGRVMVRLLSALYPFGPQQR